MINERLKTLRQDNKLTQLELASRLGVATTTIASYEQGRNEPNITMLNKIADFFDVSIEYLLGLTDTKSTDLEISYISNYLGLTERSINELHHYSQIAKRADSNGLIKNKLKTLNMFFEPGCELLEHITDYLYFSATHFKKFSDDRNNALVPISDLELWDDVEKISYSDDWDMWSKALLLIIEEELLRLREDKQFERYAKETTD